MKMPRPSNYQISQNITSAISEIRPPSGFAKPFAFVDAFAEGAADLVRWLENTGRGRALDDPDLIREMKSQIYQFMGFVARHYGEPAKFAIEAEIIERGVFRFHIGVSGKLWATMIDREPLLCAALNRAGGMCTCGVVPGAEP